MLRDKIEETCGLIPDKALRAEYRRALLNQFFDRGKGDWRVSGGSAGLVRRIQPITRSVPAPDDAAAERARCLVAILLRHPALLADVEEAFGSLSLPSALARLRQAMLEWSESVELLDSTALMTHLSAVGLAAEVGKALAGSPNPLPDCAAPEATVAEAEEGWWHFFGLMHRSQLDAEVAQAVHDFERRPDDLAAQRRVISLRAAQEALNRGEQGMDIDR
jgi:DNA primase